MTVDADRMDGAVWRSSGGSGGGRIEIAELDGSKEGSRRVIAMRDAGDRDGAVLIFTPAEWQAFTAGVRDGEFDLDRG